MRFALLIFLISCAARPAPRTPPDDNGLELEPPVATFRWALAPVACDVDGRSTIDTCASSASLHEAQLVAVYTPSDDESLIAVVRYDGDHIGAPLAWQRNLDFGRGRHSAVVTVVRGTVIVAAIVEGAAKVIAIDNVRGRLLGEATIVGAGAQAVQLEGINDFARIHVRTATGGVVAVMHPRTARVIATREVDERSIVEHSAEPVEPTRSLDGVTVGWELDRLVVRRGKAWMKYVRLVHTTEDQVLHRAALQRAGDRMLVTVHDLETGRIEVFAFDHETGAQRWRSRLTSDSRRVANALVRSAIDDDQLVVEGSSEIDRFACSIGIADGVERACIERFQPTRIEVFDEIDLESL